MRRSKRAIEQAFQQAREQKAIDVTVQMSFLISVLVLNGEFGYGNERLQRFSAKFAETFKDYISRYGEVALDALIKHAKEKGIEVDWL